MPKKCVVCHQRAPQVPDRNVMGRPIKRVCRECHAERLIGDLQDALKARNDYDRQRHIHDLELVGQRGPEVLIWKCKTCGEVLS